MIYGFGMDNSVIIYEEHRKKETVLKSFELYENIVFCKVEDIMDYVR